jgi:hypothetical protein
MNCLNGLDFIKEFSKYVIDYTNVCFIKHERRCFFHHGYKDVIYRYGYMIKASSLSLYEESKYCYNIKFDLNLNELSKFNKFRIKFFWSAYWKNRIFNLYGFYKEEVAVHIIERYWKKYRYNIYKKRRDPLKRELMEYCYHPSRLTF